MQLFPRKTFIQSLNETNKISSSVSKDLIDLIKDEKSKKRILDYFKTDLSEENLELVNSDNFLFCTNEKNTTTGEITVCWFNTNPSDSEYLPEKEKLVQGWFYVEPTYSSKNSVSDDDTDETYSDDSLTNEDEIPGLVVFYMAVLLENGNLKDVDHLGEFDIDGLNLF